MAYSFTEKKRIRKDFSKQKSILDVPFLLATQIDSFRTFLQLDNKPDERENVGLHAAFSSVFPIVSHSGSAVLEYVSYRLGEPPFDVRECQLRGVTYAAPLRDWLDNLRPGSLLILDEAHHAAPSSGAKYAIDSKITRAIRDLAPRFEHRLFLSTNQTISL